MQRSTTRSRAWIWQAVTGVLLLVLLSVHMIAQHFIVEGGLRGYADVVSYLRNPVVLVTEIAFLVVVTAHALLGVRAVIFDFGLTDEAEAKVSGALVVLGAATIAYSLWLIWAVAA